MMSASREFAGRRVLVIGGTKGIGAAIAVRLRTAGMTGFGTPPTS
jgi:NAD(P)-dependent dehydrogenase (short-subunit alcohol dehydrogenase family)